MTDDLIANLLRAMEAEISAFDACVEAQRGFSAAMDRRDWPELERSMAGFSAIAARINESEAARATAETLARMTYKAAGDGIRSLALCVREPDRTTLIDTHRRLRIATLRVRLENGAIGEYAKSSRDFLGEALALIFPDKRGKIYGRSGRTVEAGHDAILLNTAM